MLRPRQIAICIACASAFWLLATALIRLNPASVSAGWQGDLSFLTALPGSWLCIWLVCRVARLETPQILPGCMIVLGDAMLLDGVALRWFPSLYGANDLVARTGAAWLLWGYGASAWIAFLVARRQGQASVGA